MAAVISDWFSIAGDSDRADVNTFYLQYIITYFLANKWYLSSAPINTANWEEDSDNRWTIPLGGGFGKVFRIGKLPINASTQAFYNVEKPDNAPEWQWRIQFTFLFPKNK